MNKILIVTDAWNQTNGVVTTYTNVIKDLKLDGYEVDVIHPELFKTFNLPMYKEIKIAFPSYKKFKKIFDKIDPDYIHIATEGTLGVMARKLCKKRKYNYSTSFHTKFPEYIEKMTGLPSQITHKYFKWFHKHSHKILVPTESVKTELKKMKYKHLKVWCRGVDEEIFNKKGEKDLFKDLPKPIYLNVGRVSVEKNLEAFLDAKLKGTKVIVGNGPDMEKLKDKYPNAIFLGEKKGKELAACYRSANCFVFPSKTDTLGIVQLEAMACGIPVVGFNVTGPKDIITHGKTGFVANDQEEFETYCRSHKSLRSVILDKSVHSWGKCADIFVESLIGKSR